MNAQTGEEVVAIIVLVAVGVLCLIALGWVLFSKPPHEYGDDYDKKDDNDHSDWGV